MKLHQESFRALIRAISIHEKEVLKMCDNNQFVLNFLESQLSSKALRGLKSGGGQGSKEMHVEGVAGGEKSVSERPSLFDLYTKETQLVAVDTTSLEGNSELDMGAGEAGISMVIDREKNTTPSTKKKKKLSLSSSATATAVNTEESARKKKKTKTR